MNTQDADNTLKNVLAACDMAPNTIPIDKLLLRQKFGTAPYDICLRLLLLQIIILLVLPFLFVFF